MNSEILKKYNTLLTESSFIPIPDCEQFSPAGSSWQLSPELGGGHYWLYAQKDLFDIKIHDFYFHNDFVLNFDIPEGISITRYDSISGEELNPYRRLSAGSITRQLSISASPFIPSGSRCFPHIMRIT